MPEDHNGFKVYYSRSKSDENCIVMVICYLDRRIGAIRAIRVPMDAHPCVGSNIYYTVDMWEMVESRGIHCITDDTFESKELILCGVGDIIHIELLKKVKAHGGSLIYNFMFGAPPTTISRALWNQFIEEGKAAMVDPDIPLIVMPPPPPEPGCDEAV